jgi:hypothetical protein
MSKSISSTYTSEVTLTSSASNPVSLTSTAKLTPTAASISALYGNAGIGWTITNGGLISGGSLSNGIKLGASSNYVPASVITNQTGATISGTYGIRIYNNTISSITNQTGADIAAIQSTLATDSAVYMYGSGTVANFGTITAPTSNTNSRGVFLDSGGVVTNNSTGTITGGVGVFISGSSVIRVGDCRLSQLRKHA